MRTALRLFAVNQTEYEWTTLALAMYLSDSIERPVQIRKRNGQHLTFDPIAERLMRESLGHGVCYGGHRLFRLAMLARIDEMRQSTSSNSRGLFSAEVREEIRRHLSVATQMLAKTQHLEGCWDDRWPGYSIPSDKKLWAQGARLVATGHALEWWAMLSDDSLLPPRESIVRAGQWLVEKSNRWKPRP